MCCSHAHRTPQNNPLLCECLFGLEGVDRTGYPNYVIARPRLYDLLYSQIPKDKVHMNKRVESIEQDDKDDGQVTITFTDKTTAQGHILVGADGAYSGIRQLLYNQLDQQGKLPPSDKEELPCSSICLVGQTRPLSTDKFPYLLEKYCRMENVSGKNKPYTVRPPCYTVGDIGDRKQPDLASIDRIFSTHFFSCLHLCYFSPIHCSSG